MGHTNDFEDFERHKFDLGFCKGQIKSWKKWYMRKNSKHPAKILLRCCFSAPDKIFWRYYLELWINGKMKDQTLITAEAYDTFDYDKSLKKEEFRGLEFITLHEFTPPNIA